VRPDTGEVTLLLRQLRSGDKDAAPKLVSALYSDLRQVAARAMRNERISHTLQPTALVNEAFLRLAAQSGVEFTDRAQFLGIAGRVMREILVDYARQRSAVKRSGGIKVTFDEGLLLSDDRVADVVALDEILDRLEEMDARQARIVELRFFAGLNVEEVAEVLQISTPTVKREWASAKAWLRRELSEPRSPSRPRGSIS